MLRGRYLVFLLFLIVLVLLSNLALNVYSVLYFNSQDKSSLLRRKCFDPIDFQLPGQHLFESKFTQKKMPFFKKQIEFKCEEILKGDVDETNRAEDADWAAPQKDYEVYQMLQDCRNLAKMYYWPTEPRTSDEADFPLAFTILVNEDTDHVIALINALYAPQNLYYISVDLKANQIVQRNVELFANCIEKITGVQNILLSRKQSAVVWGSFSQLEPLVDMLSELDESNHPWKYAVSLFNKQFPLKTNGEIVSILRLLRGVSDVKVTKYGIPDRFKEFNIEGYEPEHGLPNSRIVVKNETNQMPKITTFKGVVSFSASRQFSHFISTNPTARAFLHYLRHTSLPDEHFFNTVYASPDLNATGGYPGRCYSKCKRSIHYFTRYALFVSPANNPKNRKLCKSKMARHNICMMTPRMLPFIVKLRYLIVDKFWSNRGFVARECLRELLFNRTFNNAGLGRPNLDEYRKLDTVKYGEHLQAGLDPDTFDCNC